MFILPHRTWKDKVRSVILDWKQKFTGPSSDGGRSSGLSNESKMSAGLSNERIEPLVIQADLSAPRVSSLAVTLLHKKGPHHRKKICANFLWLYSYYTKSSQSKNKNINYIFIYLRILCCWSCGSIHDSFNSVILSRIS